MTVLTNEQRAFLEHHKIPLSWVFDAANLKKAEYQEAMRELDMLIAVGTSACKAAGHRMRTRAGHCAQCNPATLAFMRRNDAPGYVYIAAPANGAIVKVGSSQNPTQRMDTLNAFEYGGYRDWRLQFSEKCERAGNIEFNAHRMLSQYATPGIYRRGSVQVNCQELFACGLADAIAIVKAALAGQVADARNKSRADKDPPHTEKPAARPAPKASHAPQPRPMPRANTTSHTARVDPHVDSVPTPSPTKKRLQDHLWPLAMWVLPLVTFLCSEGKFGHKLTMAFVVLVVQFPISMVGLLVGATIFKSLRGLWR
ncbi:GIY-YIG nuclease family protein [Caballeronia sp. dw_276]|uniref:GIY-YIG nuclease family protein n=1 Tax=Caballeronia sp. dw_276 TaxID=2719795 RepID=UPI001BD63167|nr:GIY-YIG nuclease family protein [Caballeronia sp. dw_276]